MNKLLVVKSSSRLGLQRPPFGGDADKNIGVEEGPQAIVDSGVFDDYDAEFLSLHFPAPEDAESDGFLQTYAKHLAEGIAVIQERQAAERLLVNLGGDHSVAFMSLAAALLLADDLVSAIQPQGAARASKQPKVPVAAKPAQALLVADPDTVKSNIGFLQIDSHTDIHSLETSPSGNFHGMWVRPFVDAVGVPELDRLAAAKLRPENMMYLGNLVVEPAEQEFLDQQGICRLDQRQLLTQSGRQQVLDYIARLSHVHVSIDVDAFHESIAPGTGIKAANGIFLSDIEFALTALSQHQSISIDLVEYNPRKDVEGKTLELIRGIMLRLLG